MSKDVEEQLLDGHISPKQAKLAIEALHKHATTHQQKKEEKSLLGGKDQHIWLVVSVKKTYPEGKLKPFRVPVKHTLVDPRESNVCLITKDPQRTYKDLLDSHKIKFIHRVVGVEKLKGKFRPFEARRLLLKENGLFLADERIVPLLPKLLGKVFFEAKKQPIPVNITKKDLKTELEKAINSTYMHQNQGTCTSVKLATSTHTPSQVFDNLQTAIPVLISRIRDGWDNIQSLHIKTSNSVSLPIWTCDLRERWGGKTLGVDDGEEWGGIGADGVQKSEDVSATKPKKRKVMEEEEDVALQPSEEKGKKKSKKRAAEVVASTSEDSSAPSKLQKPKSKTRSSEEIRNGGESKEPSPPLKTPLKSALKSSVTTPDSVALKKKVRVTGLDKKKATALKSPSVKRKPKASLIGR